MGCTRLAVVDDGITQLRIRLKSRFLARVRGIIVPIRWFTHIVDDLPLPEVCLYGIRGGAGIPRGGIVWLPRAQRPLRTPNRYRTRPRPFPPKKPVPRARLPRLRRPRLRRPPSLAKERAVSGRSPLPPRARRTPRPRRGPRRILTKSTSSMRTPIWTTPRTRTLTSMMWTISTASTASRTMTMTTTTTMMTTMRRRTISPMPRTSASRRARSSSAMTMTTTRT